MNIDNHLQDIVHKNRFYPVSYAPFMVAYFPLGLILALVRSIIFIHIHLVSFLLESIPCVRRLLVRFMCGVLGLFVIEDRSLMSSTTSDSDLTSKQKIAFVSNHLSLFDYLIMSLVRPCFTTNRRIFYWPNSCSPCDIQSDSAESLKSIIQNRDKPVHLLPECTPTGTTNLLLKFNAKYFEGVDVVQPVAINGYRIFPISFIVYPLNWGWELFWQLLTPFTLYKLYYLDLVTRNPDESNEQLADRVARLISVSLHSKYLDNQDSKDLDTAIKTSMLNASQNASHQQASSSRPKVSPSMPVKTNEQMGQTCRPVQCNTPSSRITDEMKRNIQAVLDVLPHVPYHIVLKELERSNGDVDGVITDILEERTDLTTPPPPESPIVMDNADQKNSPVPPCSYFAADKSFGHKAEDRHRSFQDRKKLFLENARKSYFHRNHMTE